MWAEWLHHPCLLGHVKVTGPRVSWGVEVVGGGGVRLTFWNVCLSACLCIAVCGCVYPFVMASTAHGWFGFGALGGILRVPNKRGQNQKWLHHPCLLMPSQGSPIEGDKFRRVYITPEFLGADSLVVGGGGRDRHGWEMVKKKRCHTWGGRVSH